MEKISHKRLLERIKYDPLTGIFSRILGTGGTAKKHMGTVDKDGYVQVHIEYQTYLASHLAWFYVTKTWSDRVLDHRDGNRANNIFSNLRETDNAGNAQNRQGANKGKFGGLPLGVYPQGDRFYSSICTRGVKRRLGTFSTPDEAYAAYLLAKREFHSTNTL